MKKPLLSLLLCSLLCTAGIGAASAEYVSPGPFAKYATQKVVYELTSNDPYAQQSIMTNLTNHLKLVDQPELVLVVHNEAVRAFLENGGNKNTKEVADRLTAQGVKILLCNTSLRTRDIDYHTLHNVKATDIVSTAIGEIIYRQQQGYYYVHP